MPKTRNEKEKAVVALSSALAENSGTVFASYNGLTVAETFQLRQRLRKEGATLLMTKKTLLRFALKERGITVPEDVLSGAVTVALGHDEVSPAKVMHAFARETKGKLTILGGVLGGTFMGAAEVKNLAALPSKQELLAKVVGSIASPLSGFANVLSGNLRGFVQVLRSLSERQTS